MKETDIDSGLFRQIKNGDQKAFRELFMKYFSRLCVFVQTILRAEEKAQEVVQKVFVKLWEKRMVINITQTVYGYLFTSCKNESFNLIKMEKTRNKYEQQYILDYKSVQQYEMKQEEVNIGSIVNKAIAELPDKCREIYTLSKKEGLSYQEIADFLKISEKTVENQIGIALKKLRESLTPYLSIIHE